MLVKGELACFCAGRAFARAFGYRDHDNSTSCRLHRHVFNKNTSSFFGDSISAFLLISAASPISPVVRFLEERAATLCRPCIRCNAIRATIKAITYDMLSQTIIPIHESDYGLIIKCSCNRDSSFPSSTPFLITVIDGSLWKLTSTIFYFGPKNE